MFKNKKNKIVVVIAIIVVLAIIIAAFANYMAQMTLSIANTNASPSASVNMLDENGQAKDGTAQDMSRDDILADLQKRQQLVTDKVSSNITFTSGKPTTAGEWIMENTEANRVIQQAEIYLGDENLLIAKTEPVYPGQYIQTIELLENLEPGEYTALAYINYYNAEDKTFAGQAAYKVHMTVQ